MLKQMEGYVLVEEPRTENSLTWKGVSCSDCHAGFAVPEGSPYDQFSCPACGSK